MSTHFSGPWFLALRRVRLKALAGAAVFAGGLGGSGTAAAQYGAQAPLPLLPPTQGVAPTTVEGQPVSNVPAAVGDGESTPVSGAPTTRGEVLGESVGGAPTTQVAATEAAQPVATGDSLPFTGMRIWLLGAMGAGLMLTGLALRRRISRS